MVSYPKVLFSTVWRSTSSTSELYDYLGSYILDQDMYRYSYPRHISYGLRFLKENFPFIEILEYPTEKEFSEKLNESWDIIGFSFYSAETNELLKMVHNAKTTNPNTKIWAGNYGALEPSIKNIFDRIFIGYAEYELSQIFQYPLRRIIHPPLITRIEDSRGRPLFPIGILFTTRGCRMKCDFCQTVSFAQNKVSLIDHQSIDAVLSFYQGHGIRDIMILDENFGNDHPSHNKEIIRMLEAKGLKWYCLTTMRTADKFQQDSNKHFAGAFIAIESFSRQLSKKYDKDKTIDFFRRFKDNGKLSVGFFMIGWEDDTEESICRDFELLERIDLNFYQVTILTPFPDTKLHENISQKYGITDHNLDHYDARHLVWNHPNFNPDKLQYLMNRGLLALNNSSRVLNLGFQWLELGCKIEQLTAEQSLSLGIRKFYQANKLNPTAMYEMKASYEIDDVLPVWQGRFNSVEENASIEVIRNQITRITIEALIDILSESDEQFVLAMLSRHGAINVMDLFSLFTLDQIRELSANYQKVMLECSIEKLLKFKNYAGNGKVFALVKKLIAQRGEDDIIRNFNSIPEHIIVRKLLTYSW